MNLLSKKFLLFIIIIEIIFSSIFGMYIYNEESSQIKSKFKKDVNDKISILDMELLLKNEALYSLRGVFDNSDLVTYPEFKALSKQILERHNTIKALEWAPKIVDEERQFYEALIKKDFPLFEITQIDTKSKKLVKRDISQYYYPILYLEPMKGNEDALGFDLASESVRLKVLEQSTQKNSLLSTSLINLVQNDGEKKGFLSVLPIYEKKSLTEKSRLKNVLGFVIAVFDVEPLITSAIHKTHTDGINFIIYDITNKKNELIYKSQIKDEKQKDSYKYEKILKKYDGRIWKIVAYPTKEYISERRTVLPSMIILISVVFILFTTFYINLIIQRNNQIERKVQQRTKELNKANEKLKEISRTDTLTNIANRRFFNETIHTEWYRAIREKTTISLMLIDVDHFKLYNDKYGHIKGDKCLQEVALCLKTSLNRSSDFLARYGGEEFVIILPNTKDAHIVAETCRKNIENLKLIHESSKISKYVTISVGITSITPNVNSSLTNFINQADKALYEAKANGRNCISIV